MSRWSLAFSLCIAAALMAGCDATTASTDALPAPPDGARLVATGTTGDLFFQPVAWRDGERLVVEQAGVQMESLAHADASHSVSLRAPGQLVRRIVGLLDGLEVFATTPEVHSGTAEGGTTSIGPTSIHWIESCRAGTCTRGYMYDYDLHAPDGDGTAQWTVRGSAPMTIDMLRFEVSAPQAHASAVVEIASSQALAVVQ